MKHQLYTVQLEIPIIENRDRNGYYDETLCLMRDVYRLAIIKVQISQQSKKIQTTVCISKNNAVYIITELSKTIIADHVAQTKRIMHEQITHIHAELQNQAIQQDPNLIDKQSLCNFQVTLGVLDIVLDILQYVR